MPLATISASFIAGLLVLIGAIGVAVCAMLWLRRRAKSAASRCGSCGYIVTGLPTFTCPECGSDLRLVGIVRTRPKPIEGSPALRLVRLYVLWSIGILIFWVVGWAPSLPDAGRSSAVFVGLVDQYLWPYSGDSVHTVTLTPRSDVYQRITVSETRRVAFNGWRSSPVVPWTGDAPASGVVTWTMSMEIQPGLNKTTPLAIDLPAGRAYTFTTEAGVTLSGKPVDADAIHQWMLASGAVVPTPLVRVEAEALAELVQDSATRGAIPGPSWAQGRLERLVAEKKDAVASPMQDYAFSSSRGSAADQFSPAIAINWVGLPLCAAVWTAGMVILHRRHHRKMIAQTPEGTSKTLTVLFTDMKDYTARAAGASRPTLLAMLDKNRQVVETAISRRDGQVVKTMGDAFLITFESATNAVLAGIAIQQAAARHNATAVEADQLELRVAICTGEVTYTNDDIFGTPVNIAARLQTMASPGEVLFTESTFHAMNVPEVGHEDVGDKSLKGIPGMVRVFRAKV